MRVKVRGRYFELVERRTPDFWGYVDHAKRQIVIHPDAAGVDRLGTIIHEVLHAAYPDLDEGPIDHASDDLAKILWRLGYRDEKTDTA